MATVVFNFLQSATTLARILWCSVSSIQFYFQVIRNYEGYGIKYILNICFISSALCCLLILNYLDNIKDYLNHGIPSSYTSTLDHLISQMPEFNYTGREIVIEGGEPVYINNVNGHTLIAIDPENKIVPSERRQIPLILSDTKITISMLNTQDASNYKLQLDYKSILGNSQQTITQNTIKLILEQFVQKTPFFITYVLFPIFAFFIFINTLIEKTIIIFAIFLLTSLMNVTISLKTCCRSALFASGLFTMLQPIAAVITLIYGNHLYAAFVWVIQIWANFLLIFAVVKISNKKIF